MAQYLAVIHQGDKGTFGVSFPDVPGCISAGRTLDIALRNAGEALAFHFEGMAEDGDAPPSASDWQTAAAVVLAENADPEGLRGFHWVTAAKAEPDRTVRLSVTLPQSLVDEIEAHVGERGRSGFLADSARTVLRAAGSGRAVTLGEAASEEMTAIEARVKKRKRLIGGPAGRKDTA